jgi:multiple sugar transport system permease protein
VGLRQYRTVIQDPVFTPALKNTILWTFGVTVMQFCLGLILALLLNNPFRGRGLLRSLGIIPWVIPGIVVAVIWRLLYASDFGLINSALRSLGLGTLTRPWLIDTATAMPAVMVAGAWKGFGFYMLMFLAGLQGIPIDLYEAARLDGAGRVRLFKDITVPLLRPVILMSVVLGVIWTSNYFEAIYVLTGGGPARLTETLPIFVYKTAFQYFHLNEAVAGSIILLLIVLSLVTVYLIIFLRLNRQEDVL